METINGGRADLDAKGAEIVADRIERRAARQPNVVLGVVGGRSVGGIYKHLRDADLPWEQVHYFMADERLVPITSDESNFKLVRDDLIGTLIDSGKLPPENAHAFELDESLPDMGAGAYTDEFSNVGGKFDIAIMSAGEDGHTASLFPNHPSVEDESEGFIVVENSPKPPPRRISASRRMLERTSTALMIFYGEAKRDALAKFRDKSIDVLGCPSKVVITLDEAFVITDL